MWRTSPSGILLSRRRAGSPTVPPETGASPRPSSPRIGRGEWGEVGGHLAGVAAAEGVDDHVQHSGDSALRLPLLGSLAQRSKRQETGRAMKTAASASAAAVKVAPPGLEPGLS